MVPGWGPFHLKGSLVSRPFSLCGEGKGNPKKLRMVTEGPSENCCKVPYVSCIAPCLQRHVCHTSSNTMNSRKYEPYPQ